MVVETHLSDLFDLSQFAHSSLFDGCSYPWEALVFLSSYLQKEELGRIEIEIPSSVYLVDPSLISIGAGTIVEPGAYIKGPCIIGKGCTIRHGAYLRGDLIIGDHCVIGHDTEVKRSIFLDRACAAHFNYVGDSILGNRANLGAGVKCANLRLDHKGVHIAFGDKWIDTHLEKLGAIVGDDAKVGCNCVLNPGTVLGKNSFCFPCLNVHGVVPPGAKVKPASKNRIEG